MTLTTLVSTFLDFFPTCVFNDIFSLPFFLAFPFLLLSILQRSLRNGDHEGRRHRGHC
jgi:hypothetical protein